MPVQILVVGPAHFSAGACLTFGIFNRPGIRPQKDQTVKVSFGIASYHSTEITVSFFIKFHDLIFLDVSQLVGVAWSIIGSVLYAIWFISMTFNIQVEN